MLMIFDEDGSSLLVFVTIVESGGLSSSSTFCRTTWSSGPVCNEGQRSAVDSPCFNTHSAGKLFGSEFFLLHLWNTWRNSSFFRRMDLILIRFHYCPPTVTQNYFYFLLCCDLKFHRSSSSALVCWILMIIMWSHKSCSCVFSCRLKELGK